MKYKKITGTKSGLGKYHSLWVGEDHLLAVESTGYSEEYTRYYFKDMQALVSRRSARGKILNAVFGSLTALCLLAGAGSKFDDPAWVVVGAIPLLLLVINLLHGPTCRCHVYTELGGAELPTVSRLRRLKKLTDTLYPLIALAQGELGRDRIAPLAEAARTAPKPAAAARPARPAPAARQESATGDYRGSLHLTAFSLLLLHGALVALWKLYATQLLLWLAACVSLFFFGVAIVALVKQKEGRVAPLGKWMTWSGLASVSVGSLAGYFFTMFLNLEHIRHSKPGQFNQFEMYQAVTPVGHPAYSTFLIIYAALTAVIALTGLVAMLTREPRGAGRRP